MDSVEIPGEKLEMDSVEIPAEKILLPGARILRTKRVGRNLGEAVEIPEKTLGKKRLRADSDSKRARNLWLQTGAYCDPKQDPEIPLGQDAYFMCSQTIGVADGVGGLMKDGIDSGVYARQLMDNAYEFLQCENGAEVNLGTLLDFAYETSCAPGASTACMITLAGNILKAINVGDSGFLVIRNEEVVYRSPSQQGGFNSPRKLEAASSRRNPRQAKRIRLEVDAGDIVVAATDGLFDNLFDTQIEDIVHSSVRDGQLPDVIATNLVRHARRVSLSRGVVTPWTVAAVDAGRDQKRNLGGKFDDITVIVARIF